MQSRPRYISESIVIISFILALWPAAPGQSGFHSITARQNSQDDSEKIARLKSALASSDEEERRNAVLELSILRTSAAASLLASVLDDPSERVRAAAVTGLGYTGDSTYAPVVAALLAQDKETFARKAAAYALGRLRGPIATEALVAALGDKNVEVRGAAVVALGERPDSSIIEPLMQSLRDKSDFVRAQSARALGLNRSAARAATPTLIMMLDSDKSLDVKREAAIALGLIGDRSALPALNRAEKDENPYLSRAALDAIKMIEQPEPR